MANKIKGVFIAIELDQSSLKKSVKSAVTTLQSEFDGLKESLNSSLKIDTTKAESSLNKLANTLANIKNSVLSETGANEFISGIGTSQKIRDGLKEVASQAGVTSEKFQELFAKALNAERVNDTVKSFNNYVKALGLSNEEAMEHAQALGIVGDALEKVSLKYKKVSVDATAPLKKVKETLFGVGSGPTDEEVSRFTDASNTQKMVGAFNDYVKLLGLSNKEALEHAQKLGIVGKTLDEIKEKYGTTVKNIEDAMHKLASDIETISGNKPDFSGGDIIKAESLDKIKRSVDLLEQYKTATGKTSDEVIALAKAWNLPKEAIDAFGKKYENVFDRARNNVQASVDKLSELTGKVGTLPSGKEIVKAGEVEKAKQISIHILKIASGLNLTEKETLAFAKSLNLADEEMKQLESSMGRLSKKGGGPFSQLKNLMTGGNAMAAVQSSLAVLGANISVAGVVELGKAAVDATVRIDSLRTAFTSVYKDGEKASAQLGFIRGVTEELGLEFYATAEAAKGFFAAAQASSIKEQANKIFTAFSAATSALKLNQEQANGVFLAISQMMSKGKISAEELRQQLAERLPGAVQMLAQAMGKTLPELDKMLEQGEVGIENLVKLADKVGEEFFDAGKNASGALLGELNKLKSAWTDFKGSIVDSEILASSISSITAIVNILKDNMKGLLSVFSGLVAAFGINRVVKYKQAMGSLSEAFKKARAAAASFATTMRVASLSMSALTVGTGVLAAAYMYLKDVPPLATKSINELRNAVKDETSDNEKLKESVENVDEATRRLMRTRLEMKQMSLQEGLQRELQTLENLRAAIIYATKPVGVEGEGDNVSPVYDETGQKLFELYEKIGDLKVKLAENKISAKEFSEGIKAAFYEAAADSGEVLKVLSKLEVGFEETIAQIVKQVSELSNNSDLQKALEKKPLEIPVEPKLNTAKALENLKFDNIKREIKSFSSEASRELAQLFVDLAKSGDLLDGSGKAVKKSADYISDAIKRSGGTVAGLREEIIKLVGDNPKFIEAFDKATAQILAQADANEKNSRSFKKYGDFEVDLKKITEQWEDLAKAGELGSDSFAYGLYKIESKAVRARAELEKTVKEYEKIKGISSEQVTEFKTKSEAVISGEALAQEKRLVEDFKETYKEYLYEMQEFNGEITSAELKKNQDKYAKELADLDSYHAAMLDKYEANGEKQLEITAEWEDLRKALIEKKREEELRASDDLVAGLKLGLKDYLATGKGVAGQLADATLKGFQGMGDALANFVTAADKSWDSLADAFSDLARSMINDISKIIAHATIMNGMKAMFGGTSFGDFLGIKMNADGNVVNSGLGAFSNGVYNTPTFFTTNGGGFQRYANGGVFGEAGPEAIMPLTRMPNGRLGVAAMGGGGGGDVQVNVYNNSNSKAEVRQSTSSSGGKSIDVIIGDMVAKQMSTPGSKLNRTVSTYTGGQQAVTRR